MVTLEKPCWVHLSPLLLSVIFLVMMSQLLPQFFHHKMDALCFIFLSLNLFCTDLICPPVHCPWATHSMACYSILVTLNCPGAFCGNSRDEKPCAKWSCAFKSDCVRASYPDLVSEHAVEPPEPKHCHKRDKYLLFFISVVFLSVRWFLWWWDSLGELEEE